MAYLRRHYILVTIALFFIALNFLFYFWTPNEIVEYIGIQNSYLLVFCLAVIGGLSTLTGTVLYTSIVTFAAGGSTPWLLGLVGGLGIFISDSIFFYLAKLGRESVPEQWEKWIDRVRRFFLCYPVWFVLLCVYLYISFLPLPNDLLMIALVLAGYRYRTVMPVIFAGSITIAMLTAYFGALVL